MKNTSNKLADEFACIATMVKRIEVYDGYVPRIERDILLSQLRNFYETVMTYCDEEDLAKAQEEPKPETTEKAQPKTEDSGPFAPPTHPHTQEATSEQMLQPMENESYGALFEEGPSKGLVDMEFEQAESIEPEAAEEPMAEETSVDVEEQPAEATSTEEPTADEPATIEEEKKETTEHKSEPSLFDYLSQPAEPKHSQTVVTVSDRLMQSQRANVAQSTAAHKVTDLRTVININDKFSFVGSLFGNNMRAYTDFIMHLNSLTTREEADEYIGQISQQYKWNMDSIEVKNFNKILEYKF